jgi:hypothetical protein
MDLACTGMQIAPRGLRIPLSSGLSDERFGECSFTYPIILTLVELYRYKLQFCNASRTSLEL